VFLAELVQLFVQLVQQVNNFLKENEQFDDLQLDGLKIIQKTGGYKFSTDSVLLANFAKGKPSDKYLDLCSGSGVVAILFSYKNKINDAYALELQSRLADMAERSIRANNLNIKVLNCDLKDSLKYFEQESFDIITINPPYNIPDSSISEDEITIATHELKTSLDMVSNMVSKLLKFGGKLFMVHRADRLAEIVYNLKKCKLEPKRLQIIYPKVKKEPNLILIEAKKGAKAGLKILQSLVLNNDDGTETEELKKIYNRSK